ncbi:hypothetical protein C3439_11585 [Escherichia coli]|nr:hypothetical protein C3439_11585 [Escherichia coli]
MNYAGHEKLRADVAEVANTMCDLRARLNDMEHRCRFDSDGHCCKVSDEAAFCLIQRPYISKTLLTRRISPRGSP